MPALARRWCEQGEHSSDAPRFVVSGGDIYQVFTAPVRAPDEIARVALGFAVDAALARELRDLVGVDVAFLTDSTRGSHGRSRRHCPSRGEARRRRLPGHAHAAVDHASPMSTSRCSSPWTKCWRRIGSWR